MLSKTYRNAATAGDLAAIQPAHSVFAGSPRPDSDGSIRIRISERRALGQP